MCTPSHFWSVLGDRSPSEAKNTLKNLLVQCTQADVACNYLLARSRHLGFQPHVMKKTCCWFHARAVKPKKTPAAKAESAGAKTRPVPLKDRKNKNGTDSTVVEPPVRKRNRRLKLKRKSPSLLARPSVPKGKSRSFWFISAMLRITVYWKWSECLVDSTSEMFI